MATRERLVEEAKKYRGSGRGGDGLRKFMTDKGYEKSTVDMIEYFYILDRYEFPTYLTTLPHTYIAVKMKKIHSGKLAVSDLPKEIAGDLSKLTKLKPDFWGLMQRGEDLGAYLGELKDSPKLADALKTFKQKWNNGFQSVKERAGQEWGIPAEKGEEEFPLLEDALDFWEEEFQHDHGQGHDDEFIDRDLPSAPNGEPATETAVGTGAETGAEEQHRPYHEQVQGDMGMDFKHDGWGDGEIGARDDYRPEPIHKRRFPESNVDSKYDEPRLPDAELAPVPEPPASAEETVQLPPNNPPPGEGKYPEPILRTPRGVQSDAFMEEFGAEAGAEATGLLEGSGVLEGFGAEAGAEAAGLLAGGEVAAEVGGLGALGVAGAVGSMLGPAVAVAAAAAAGYAIGKGIHDNITNTVEQLQKQERWLQARGIDPRRPPRDASEKRLYDKYKTQLSHHARTLKQLHDKSSLEGIAKAGGFGVANVMGFGLPGFGMAIGNEKDALKSKSGSILERLRSARGQFKMLGIDPNDPKNQFNPLVVQYKEDMRFDPMGEMQDFLSDHNPIQAELFEVTDFFGFTDHAEHEAYNKARERDYSIVSYARTHFQELFDKSASNLYKTTGEVLERREFVDLFFEHLGPNADLIQQETRDYLYSGMPMENFSRSKQYDIKHQKREKEMTEKYGADWRAVLRRKAQEDMRKETRLRESTNPTTLDKKREKENKDYIANQMSRRVKRQHDLEEAALERQRKKRKEDKEIYNPEHPERDVVVATPREDPKDPVPPIPTGTHQEEVEDVCKLPSAR